MFRFWPFGYVMKNLNVLVLFTLLVGSSAGWAYYPTMDTGELLKAGQHRVSLEPTVVFNDMNGYNQIVRFDLPANESGNFRTLVGAGAVGFQAGALYKWIPIPDYDRQPAIGLLGGLIYARDEGINFLNLRAHPLASKKYQTEDAGIFTPFVALPFGVTFTDGKTTMPFQLAVGTEWQPSNLKKVSFMTELALNLHESFSHIAIGVRVQWDDEGGFKIE